MARTADPRNQRMLMDLFGPDSNLVPLREGHLLARARAPASIRSTLRFDPRGDAMRFNRHSLVRVLAKNAFPGDVRRASAFAASVKGKIKRSDPQARLKMLGPQPQKTDTPDNTPTPVINTISQKERYSYDTHQPFEQMLYNGRYAPSTTIMEDVGDSLMEGGAAGLASIFMGKVFGTGASKGGTIANEAMKELHGNDIQMMDITDDVRPDSRANTLFAGSPAPDPMASVDWSQVDMSQFDEMGNLRDDWRPVSSASTVYTDARSHSSASTNPDTWFDSPEYSQGPLSLDAHVEAGTPSPPQGGPPDITYRYSANQPTTRIRQLADAQELLSVDTDPGTPLQPVLPEARGASVDGQTAGQARSYAIRGAPSHDLRPLVPAAQGVNAEARPLSAHSAYSSRGGSPLHTEPLLPATSGSVTEPRAGTSHSVNSVIEDRPISVNSVVESRRSSVTSSSSSSGNDNAADAGSPYRPNASGRVAVAPRAQPARTGKATGSGAGKPVTHKTGPQAKKRAPAAKKPVWR